MVLQHRDIFHALAREADDRFTTYTPQTLHSSQSFMYMVTDTDFLTAEKHFKANDTFSVYLRHSQGAAYHGNGKINPGTP